jgi:hypothetical protein
MAGCRVPGPLCDTLDHLADKGTTNRQRQSLPGPVGLHPVKGASCAPTVKIGRVIRSNPHVDKGAKDEGLPDSLPPKKQYQVEITVTPSLDSAGCAADQFIELSIAGGSKDDAGTATISPDRITKTTTVTVEGVEQTKSDSSEKDSHAGKLKIQAKLNGNKLLAESKGFSVCAHPLNWFEAFDSDIDEEWSAHEQKHVVGMLVKISCEFDSGMDLKHDLMDLRGAEVKEVLDFSVRPKEPPFHYYPFDTSEYQLAVALGTDRHTILFPEERPDADWKIPQMSVYKCHRCGCTDVALPNSGMHIIFHVKNKKFFVEKIPASVTIKGKSVKAANFPKVKSNELELSKTQAQTPAQPTQTPAQPKKKP